MNPIMPTALDNTERLHALHALGLLDQPPTQAFDRLTTLVTTILHVPVALVSLVDFNRQFFVSCLGLPEPWASARQTPLSHSFCQHVVTTGAPLIINDARQHPLVADNLAVPDLGVVAYLGIPLTTPNGHVLGTLCAIDTQPRMWASQEVGLLSELAAFVLTELDLRRELVEHQRLSSALQQAHDELEQRVVERTTQLVEANTQLATRVTELTTLTEAMHESKTRFRSVLESAPDGILLVNSHEHVVVCNPAAQRLFGYDGPELIGQHLAWLLPTWEQTRQELISAPGTTAELIGQRKDGTTVPLELSLSTWEIGEALWYTGIIRDISARQAIEAALRQSEQDYRALFEQAHDAILILDPATETVLEANQRACGMYGLTHAELLGRSLRAVSKDVERGRGYIYQTLHSTEPITFETVQYRRDGTEVFLEVTAAVIQYHAQRAILSVNRDITERRYAAATIARMTFYDPLTHLPNRVLLQDRLEHTLAAAQRSGQSVGLLLLDLNRFKLINESFGHTLGDQVLQLAGARLHDAVRDGDTVARMGGDEFAVILPDTLTMEVTEIATRLAKIVAQPMLVEQRELVLTATLGISLFPNDGQDGITLIKHAEIALYRAKQQRGLPFQFYTPTMHRTAARQLAVEQQLRGALARKEFTLVYQPQWNVQTGQLVGVEALLRWNNPALGWVSPVEFIPIAEETDIIIELGLWALRTACHQHQTWQASGAPLLRMAVNLSARQFEHPDLVADVVAVLNETGVPASQLELEVTESMTMQNIERTEAVLRQLHCLGVSVAMDDFGTGYSSLSYLKRFPIATVKIDRSFVQDLTTNPHDAAIATAVVAMAHSLGLTVVAEGVETEEQRAFLEARGCDLIQGYLMGRPAPADIIEQLWAPTVTG